MYLPDTNIIIRALYGHNEKDFLEAVFSQNKLMLSVIVVAEFLAGASKVDKSKFDKLLKGSEVVSIDQDVAIEASKYRKKYLRKSKRVFLLDCFLAAQAKVNNLTLVTNNTQDFPMKDIKIVAPK